MIFGIDRTVAEGLGDELAAVVARVPVIVARPDAVGLLAAAGAQPFVVARVGPAIAVECPHRGGAHINGAEWTLAERGGELFISTAGPRAHQVQRGRAWPARHADRRTVRLRARRPAGHHPRLSQDRVGEDSMAPHRITVGDIISEHRRSYPGRLALADGEHHLTWAELDERVNRLANALRGVGVGPGDRILWLGQNSFRVYELLGAAAKIGAMVCPGYWRWAPPEMTFAIEDFSPKVVIWQEEEIGSTVRAARAACQVVSGSESPLWLRHDSEPRHGYEAFLASGESADPGLDIDPDSALLVIYTAAISGRPCGSMLSHTNLIAMGTSVAWLGDIDDKTVFLNSGPMFHIGNFQFYGIPVLIQGGTNVVTRRVVASEVLDILAAEKCTRAYLMPGHHHPAGRADAGARRRTAAPARPPSPLRCGRAWWRRTTAATAAKAAAWATATGRPKSPASACSAGTAAEVRATPAVPRRSPRSGSSTPSGRECLAGEAGEICVRGDTVHLGYWNRPEINSRALPRRLVAHHRPRPARARRHDHLPRHDDPDDQVRGGEHLPRRGGELPGSPPGGEGGRGDRHPERALPAGRQGGRRAERTVPATAADLIEHCRRHIASYKKPKTVEFLDALPRLAAYAKDYAALDEKFGGGGYPGGDNLGGGH